jgi:flagellar motor switch protein FliN/FliY
MLSAMARTGESLRPALVDKAYVRVRTESLSWIDRMDEPTTQNPMDAAATAAGDASQAAAASIDTALDELSSFARNLLRIRVPLQVTLASQRKSIHEIVELGPGSIVKFDKTCDEPLQLTIGNTAIAQGAVVKVGDKFGLRINGLVK